uniref:Synaptotagmin XV n=1 Tax=Kryptolebias marmoratus TaxID=37003 RepID=A0A3Q3AL97_KRYMA
MTDRQIRNLQKLNQEGFQTHSENLSHTLFKMCSKFKRRGNRPLRLTQRHENMLQSFLDILKTLEVSGWLSGTLAQRKGFKTTDILPRVPNIVIFLLIMDKTFYFSFSSGWYPVGSVLAGLYSVTPLNEVVAPPPGMATRLCFSVEYRHGSEQLMVSLLRLGNLPPRFHSNVTLVELRLLPDDRRPRQARARGTGPDPEFSDCLIFQACVSGHNVCRLVCVLSVDKDGKRHAVGRVLFPLERELGQAGRVLWRDLDPEQDTQCSELGDVQISLSYSPSLQRLSVVVLKARGLQLLTDAGTRSVCVQVSLQTHAQVVKTKRSCEMTAEQDPVFNHRMTFKLRLQNLDESCLRFELQQPNDNRSEPPSQLGVLVLGPFMYARGPQLQHWMDMVNKAQKPIQLWHGLRKLEP